MTQEEFYIWLMNCDSNLLPEFDPELLKNYEIAKLILEKFGINKLNEIQQRNLNFEAISTWFNSSEYIKLIYDIPEILELLPERIVRDLNLEDSLIQSLPQLESVGEDLDLRNSKIKFLPKLESVGDYLNLTNSQIESLPQLKTVGGGLDLRNSKIQSLPKLKTVGMSLFLRDSKIQSLPKLESVGMSLFLQDSKIQSLPKLRSVGASIYTRKNKLDYWRRYFNETGRSSLIERMVII